jgi:alanine racemase
VFYEWHLSSLTSKTGPDDVHAALRNWAEVDLAAIRHNARLLAEHAGPDVKLMAVVKANAYGHGAPQVVAALAGRVAMFGVANLSEAREIAAHAKGTPILVLGTALPAERESITRERLIPSVSSLDEAAAYARLASGGPVSVHVVIDTGMGRIGIWEADAIETVRRMIALPGLQISGIASHLPAADEAGDFTREQLARFHGLVKELRALGLGDALVHVENSAGLIAFPREAGNLARPGLALYGESPLPPFQTELRRALTWKTRVTLVRDLGAGRSVSYGRTFITPKPMRVATLAVGYADGYPRQLSGRGASVLVQGRRCAVLGRVTMDQIMVDVTGLDVAPGEEVVLLGSQKDEIISATELGLLAGTIPWDIFAGIGPRVARLYRDDDSSVSRAAFPA